MAVFHRGVRSCALVTSALTSLLVAAGAQGQSALPVGGTVASGSASIASNGATTTVTQASDRAIVTWTSFDVGAGKGVVFNQPGAQSATLNRVTGGTSSTIAGSISSNGAVYLVNPNGIAITSTGSVQTGGGFVASTLDIADADFAAGRLSFAGNGASKGVSNAGRITAGSGAYVALLGGTVSNSGTISVPLGRVGLGAGEQATLDLNGDGFMQVAVPSATDGGVAMAGAITAAGGRVELKAASVVGAVRDLVNLSGSISADSASGDAGSIVLLAGDGGAVVASGTLTARATGATGNGGTVETSGARVDFTGLKVDTAAAGRTGSWLVDPTDLTVDAASASTISAALATTNVTLQTNSDGSTSGVGATSPGNGDINVVSAIGWSSANTLSLLAYNNINLNAAIAAPLGELTLSAGNAVAYTGAITATDAVNVGIFNLVNGNWSQTGTLPSFSATDFRLDVTGANFLRASGGAGTIASPYTITDVYGLQGMASESLLASNFVLANAIDASGTAAWNGGAGFVAIGTDNVGHAWNGTAFTSFDDDGSVIGFTGNLNGGGFTVSGLTINRPGAELQGLFGLVSGSSTISNLGMVGGSVSGGQFVGGLVGYQFDGSTLSNVYTTGSVTSQAGDAGGLAGGADGTIDTAYATGSVTSRTGDGSTGFGVGGLVGGGEGTISNAYATGAVTGDTTVGGLVGSLDGPITNSYATGTVIGGSVTGGLVGSGKAITNSYATGSVTGLDYVGGLAGSATFVTNAYATGSVAGRNEVGGLIATNGNGSYLSNVYATGSVTGKNDIGGLAGSYVGGIGNAYATGAVTGANNVGGLVGTYNGASTPPVSSVYASGLVTGTGSRGGLIGSAYSGVVMNSYWDSYSTGQTSAIGTVITNTGRFPNTTQTNVSAVTSDPAQSGAATYAFSPGAYANLTAATGLGTANAAGFVFMPGAATRPFLAFETPIIGNPLVTSNAGVVTLINSHQLQLVGYNGTTLAGSYVLGNAIDLSETARVASGIAGASVLDSAGHAYTIPAVAAGSPGSYSGMWSPAGFVAIGTDGAGNPWNGTAFATSNDYSSAVGFSGSFNGAGLTVNNLTINLGGTQLLGLFGLVSGSSAISNVGLIGGSVVSYGFAGGLVGYQAAGSLSNVYTTGTVSAGFGYGGGLAGLIFGTVDNAYTTGAVTGGYVLGGLIGSIQVGGVVTNAHATGSVSGGGGDIGGLVGSSSGRIDTAYATGAVTLTNSGNYVGGLVGASDGPIANAYATGAVSGYDDVGGLAGAADSITNAHASGAVTGNAAVGGLVGNARTIANAYATGSVTGYDTVGGLAGSADTVTNAYATGAVTGDSDVGGLIGYVGNNNPGTVANVYATGSVTGTSDVGGLAGEYYGSISNAYATGAVTGSVEVGGLFGLFGLYDDGTTSSGTASSVYATGLVTGNTSRGGLIGIAYSGAVANAYWDSYSTGQAIAIGTVSTDTSGAPVTTQTNVSAVTSDPAQSAAATYAFSPGAYANLTAASGLGTANAAGFVFMPGASTRPFLAFEAPIAGNPLVTSNAGVVTLTNSHQLQLVGYNAATLAGSYTISGAIDLAETGRVANGVAGASYTDNIGNTYVVPAVAAGSPGSYSGMWAGSGFVPIGTNGAGGVYNAATGVFDANGVAGFSGAVNGGGYTLSNLTVARPGMLDVGLFGWTTGTLRNLTLTGAAVTGGTNVGALTGYLYNGAVSGVAVGATTAGVNNVGGIVGLMYKASLSTSSASGGVTGTLNAGGAVGFEQDSTITSVSTSATAAASQAYAGGLVGYQINGTTNTNVSASGAVSSPNAAGGLVGIAVGYQNAADPVSTTAAITNASATGSVTGASGTGGLVGFLGYGAAVSNAYATGTASGANNVGGLVGYLYMAGVADSYATGAVAGSNSVGGLVGIADGAATTVARTYATGAVSAPTNPGGLIGSAINGATVTRSVWDTTTTGQATSAGGGSTGYTTAQLQDATSYLTVYDGWNFTSTWLAPNQAGQNGTPDAHYPQLEAAPQTGASQ